MSLKYKIKSAVGIKGKPLKEEEEAVAAKQGERCTRYMSFQSAPSSV
jgi:hypothetical protein